MTGPNTSAAVLQSRVELPDSLDFFPTPPWATRAFCEHYFIRGYLDARTVIDPACGRGDMMRPLREYFARVEGSDIHDYGVGFPE